MQNGDETGPKENDKLKDCCAEVYEGFKKFGKKWYKFTLFRKINGLDDTTDHRDYTNGDSTMGDSTINTTADDDDEDLDGEEEEDLEGEEDGEGMF